MIALPRKSDIYEAVKRVLHYPDIEKDFFTLAYRHRVEGIGERLAEVSITKVVKLDRWAVHLDNGDTIPLHRITEIRGYGKVFWRRGEGWIKDLSKFRKTVEE